MDIKKLFVQFSKFAVVGVLNTAIDFGVLNILVFATGIKSGGVLFVLNIVAFTVATTNSYFWNKFWTFKDKGSVRPVQIGQFLTVSVIGALINSAVVYTVSTFVDPLFGLSPTIWVNVAKVVATGFSFIWNFAGYKFIVFKK
jgi:putative flippase GtrA